MTLSIQQIGANSWRQISPELAPKLRVKDGWRQFQNWRQFFRGHPSEPPKAGAKKSFGAKKTGAKIAFWRQYFLLAIIFGANNGFWRQKIKNWRQKLVT